MFRHRISQLSSLSTLTNTACGYLCPQGGLRGDDPQITLTAFVLIALAEAQQAGISCSDPNVNLEVNENVFSLRFSSC